MKLPALGAAALALVCGAAVAQQTDPQAPARPTAEQFMAQLKPQHGAVKLPNGVASLQLPDDFYYLTPDDSEKLLVDAWGNPPGDKTLGMIIPQAISPLSREGWGVVITYSDDGHIKDDDAAKIDYSELLTKMKQEDEENNKKRKEQGYAALNLIGWAAPPYYDAQAHKLYWAKELKAADATDNTLNYEIRVLGRKGVLELTAVAQMSNFPAIKGEMTKVLAFTNFDQGNRYSDFNISTDKVAAYGLAALVAGGVAAKVGLLAKLGVLLLALKKFVILGAVAVAGFFRKLFGGKPKNTPPAA
jgi:uncharacterized membrane-anchored protein